MIARFSDLLKKRIVISAKKDIEGDFYQYEFAGNVIMILNGAEKTHVETKFPNVPKVVSE